jgi:hypothetical protein
MRNRLYAQVTEGHSRISYIVVLCHLLGLLWEAYGEISNNYFSVVALRKKPDYHRSFIRSVDSVFVVG